MKVSYNWLQTYFEKKLPKPEQIGKLLTMHSFEVESVEETGSDCVLDVKVMPDRAHDCLSHRGIAREISVLTGSKLSDSIRNNSNVVAPESNLLKVEIRENIACPRFSALVVENIEVKESPKWLKELLGSIGQRSINNIVDLTNFVMFSTGQPLHAYDSALLSSENDEYKITVRYARDGEKITALDKKEYVLENFDLVICDGNTDMPLGIAGVKGGTATQITKDTKNIIIESANFEPIGIRKTAKRLGLRTDASVRFENGISPQLTKPALLEIAKLIFDIANSEDTKVEGMIDVGIGIKDWTYTIGISNTEVNSLLGLDLDDKDISEALEKLHFPFTVVDPVSSIKKIVPEVLGKSYKNPSTMRYDAPEAFSCSSLISYLYNFAGVWMPSLSIDKYVYADKVKENELKFADLIFSNTGKGKIHYKSVEYFPGTEVTFGVDHVGLYMGDDEVLHVSSITGKVAIEKLTRSEAFKNIVGYGRVPTDISKKRFVVEIPNERLDLRIKEDLIEEIGRIYGYENLKPSTIKEIDEKPEINKLAHYSDIIRGVFVKNGFSEVITYVFRNEGEQKILNPLAADKQFLRRDLATGMSESLVVNFNNLELLGQGRIREFEIGNVFEVDGEFTKVAFAIESSRGDKGKPPEEEAREIISEISKAVGCQFDFEKRGKVFEANLTKVLESLETPKFDLEVSEISNVKYSNISPYPFVLRDIAVFVPAEITAERLLESIKEKSGEFLVKTRLFDEFKKDGKTSYAFRLVFQSQDKTMTDDEVNKIMENIVASINSKGWQVR